MALNVTTAVFAENCNTATASPSLAQWDVGQILKIEGVDLPSAYQVEFSTVYTRNAIPKIGNAAGVDIPNELLQRSAPITAYIVLHEGENDRETEYWITIHITPRTPPETITPDPEEQSVIDETIAALQDGVAAAEAAAEAIQDMDVEAETLAAGSAASVDKTVDPETGAVKLKFGIPQGPQGDPMTYEDMTEEQKAELVQGPILEAQNAAVTAVGNARVNAVNAVGSAGTTAVGAVNQAGTTQVGNVNQAGTTQVQAVADKGAEVIGSIPPDYSDLADEVDDLNRQLNDETTGLDTKAPVIINSASGAIASFADGADSMPVKKLVAQIEPVQDLHGYDHPWPAGGGKNKLQNTATTQTVNGVTFTVNDDGTVTANGSATANADFEINSTDILPDGNYILSGCPSGGGISTFFLGGVGGLDTLDTGGGSNSTAYVSGTALSIYIRVANGQTANNLLFKPMIRLATETDATFAPYSNICPISGWTGASVTRTGKNLVDFDLPFTLNSSGVTNTVAKAISVPKVGSTIRCSGKCSDGTALEDVACLFRDARAQNVWNIGTNRANAVPNKILSVVGFSLYTPAQYAGKTVTEFQIEYVEASGSGEATAYEPYTGNQISVTFPSEAGTVYGGALTINPDRTGTLVVDRAEAVYTGDASENWQYRETSDGSWRFLNASGKMIGAASVSTDGAIMDAISNQYKFISRSATYYRFEGIGIAAVNTTALYLYDEQFTTVAELTTYLATHNLKVVYPLADPVTIQLTAEQVSGILTTLYGTNNIWASTGDTEVTYPADTRLFIEQLTKPTEDDMTADHAISAGTFFQLGNTLYRATAQIAAGGTITPGTNATKLSLADALNQLNA